MLKLDFCSAKAARYAVMNWHYSQKMPIGRLVRIGVWEFERFVGVVLYGRGASNNFHKRYNVKKEHVAELVRVALRSHKAPVSQIVAQSIRLLRPVSPGLRLLFSFADPAAGHHGGIYQAGNWVYSGESAACWEYLINGKWTHNREATFGAFGNRRALPSVDLKQVPRRKTLPKHRYLYPLDKGIRKQLVALAKPYPKRQPVKRAAGDQPAEGGAEPTLALQGVCR